MTLNETNSDKVIDTIGDVFWLAILIALVVIFWPAALVLAIMLIAVGDK